MMNEELDEKEELLSKIFFHKMSERIDSFKKGNVRYVHYTSAAVLKSVLENKEIWLRSTTLMNDFQEIERGIEAVSNFFGTENPRGQKFWKIVDQCFPDVSQTIKTQYNNSLSDLRFNTFMMSLSVHLDIEDLTGRLSMWRAYAPENGAALVINPEPLYSKENRLDVFSYPALYWTKQEIFDGFSEVVDLFEQNIDALKKLNRDEFTFYVIEMFTSYAICLKHPGFSEEIEMRLVFRPKKQTMDNVKKSVEVIRTVPQVIYKIPLEQEFNIDLNSLVNRIIIGPSDAIPEMRMAISHLMHEAQIADVDRKLYFSEIPLRT